MAKEFTYYGKTTEELKKMSVNEFMQFINARARRSLKRGFTEQQKKLLKLVEEAKQGKFKKPIKTHCRNMLVLPSMIGLLILVYNGKTFQPVSVTEEMIGHYLGEFSHTRQKVKHSAPGIGATKSSSAVSVK